LEIRVITDPEMERAFYLSAQAFRHGERDDNRFQNWLNDTERSPSTAYGVWDEGGMQAKVVVIHYKQHFGPHGVIPMGGIAGVASLPASRGKGYAGTCLKYVLERMRDDGEVISALFPFAWDFYRKLGWEWVGIERRYQVPTRILKSDPETERVRAAETADRSAIIACYTEFAGRYRGAMERRLQDWNRILDHGDKNYTYTYLYEQEGKIEGYFTYRGGKKEETRLREFISLTPRAQRALLGLMRRHEMQVEKFAWTAPSDDPLWSQYYHWDIETKLEPVTMSRVVDVPGAFAYCRPAPTASGSVTVAVEDACAPWNTGTWRIAFEGGKAQAERTHADPQVSMDIQALSQAYHGMPTLEMLRSAERLTVHDEAGFAALQQLLDGPPMWMNDGF